jgi:group I intron endonuclease
MPKVYGRIYVITNTVNGKRYVGQTIKSVQRRFSDHKRQSAFNDYPLYRAFKKHGQDVFEVKEIDEAKSRADLDTKEIYWIEKLNTMLPAGYNAILGTPGTGELSQQSRDKKSDSMKKRWQNPEYRQKVTAAVTGENNQAYGRPLTKEHRDKLSKARAGKPIPLQQRAKIAATVRNKLQEDAAFKEAAERGRQKAKLICSRPTINLDTGCIYQSAKEAARQTGLSQQNISKCCTGQRKTSGGYRWAYVE